MTDLIRAWFAILIVAIVLGTYVWFVEKKAQEPIPEVIGEEETALPETSLPDVGTALPDGSDPEPDPITDLSLEEASETPVAPETVAAGEEQVDDKNYNVESEQWEGERAPPIADPPKPEPAEEVKPVDLGPRAEKEKETTLCSLLGPGTLVARERPKRGEGLLIRGAEAASVFAVAAGRVAMTNQTSDGYTTVYVVAKDGKLTFTYAGLAKLSDGLTIGVALDCGAPLGRLSSGFRFAVRRAEKPAQWWKGTPVDPRAFLGPEPETPAEP